MTSSAGAYHHFLNHAATEQSEEAMAQWQRYLPSFTVEVTELAVFRHNLLGVNLGMVREDVLPPLLLVELL